MSARISHKYIESHWLVFTVQGMIALLFGSVALFTTETRLPLLVAMASVIMLILGMIEFFNLMYREKKHYGMGTTAVIALIELGVATALMLTVGKNVAWHVVLIALYALTRGIFDITTGLRPKVEATDRFAWLVCGICGVLFGVAILNAGHLNQNTAFITYFGAYLMIFGATNLFYGVHNRNEKLELIAERKEMAKKRAEARLIKRDTRNARAVTKKKVAKKSAEKPAKNASN